MFSKNNDSNTSLANLLPLAMRNNWEVARKKNNPMILTIRNFKNRFRKKTKKTKYDPMVSFKIC
jgi:hypothetical protein